MKVRITVALIVDALVRVQFSANRISIRILIRKWYHTS